MKGLGEVIVAAGFEPADAVIGIALDGQEHDGRLIAVATHGLADLEAVQIRHHDVEQDEIDRMSLHELSRALLHRRARHRLRSPRPRGFR